MNDNERSEMEFTDGHSDNERSEMEFTDGHGESRGRGPERSGGVL